MFTLTIFNILSIIMNLAKFVVVGTLLSFKWKNVIISVRHNFDISYT